MISQISGIAIIACWVIFLLYWIVKARGVKPQAERQNRGATIGYRVPVVIAGFLLWAGRWPYPLNVRVSPTTDWVSADAAVVCVLGVGVAIWARRTIADNWSSDVTFKQGHELIQTGPYRYVRHPIYSGLLLMCLAILLAAGQLHCWLGLCGMFVGFWIKLRQEERMMLKHFPGDYPAYRKRVKALVPFMIALAAWLRD